MNADYCPICSNPVTRPGECADCKWYREHYAAMTAAERAAEEQSIADYVAESEGW